MVINSSYMDLTQPFWNNVKKDDTTFVQNYCHYIKKALFKIIRVGCAFKTKLCTDICYIFKGLNVIYTPR